MTERLLPVLETSEDCAGACDRRTLLKALGIAGLVSACRIDDPGSDPAPLDGAPGDAPDPGFATCNTDQICFDLTNPRNAPLLNVGGFRSDIVVNNKRFIVIRTTETEFVSLSARCTHAGTTVGYRVAQNDLRCPNHGSVFAIDGTVVTGPAVQPLTVFANTFDMAGNQLTVTIA